MPNQATVKKYIRGTLLDRFNYYHMPEPNTGCWLWFGEYVRPNSYGKLKYDGNKAIKAHRFSYETFKGKIPEGMCVLHTCDVPSCVNPDHLFLGTQKDNAIDRKNKNRGNNAIGESHGRSKITEIDVLFIRESGLTTKELMAIFNLDRSTVRRAATGKCWSHVI